MEDYFKQEILDRILAWEDRSIPFSVPFPYPVINRSDLDDKLNAHFRNHNVAIDVTYDFVLVFSTISKKKKTRQLFEESYPDLEKPLKDFETTCKEIEDEINAKLDGGKLKFPLSFVLKTQPSSIKRIYDVKASIIRSVLKGRESPGYQLNIEFTCSDDNLLWVDISVQKE